MCCYFLAVSCNFDFFFVFFFFFKQKTAYEIGLGIPAEPLFRSPSGLTPSQLYVFMPPNLGGFFMVRSYYPSECHADYFDFELMSLIKMMLVMVSVAAISKTDRKSVV